MESLVQDLRFDVGSFAPAEFLALQRDQKVFDQVTTIRGGDLNLSSGETHK